MVLPLFPLGAVAYTPGSTQVLNIFEPRYRAMYNDILFSGARRFMVCNVDGATGRLAEVGVLFYLDDLKEVSEQTGDRVKFVGSHSVSGRGRAAAAAAGRCCSCCCCRCLCAVRAACVHGPDAPLPLPR